MFLHPFRRANCAPLACGLGNTSGSLLPVSYLRRRGVRAGHCTARAINDKQPWSNMMRCKPDDAEEIHYSDVSAVVYVFESESAVPG